MLRLISLVLMFYSYFLIRTSLSNLPPCIPTHFDAAGNANGWGSPNTLWFLLIAQVVTGVVFLFVPYMGRRFPGIVNLGTRRLSDYTPAQQARILPLLHDMMAYMSILMNLFFVFMLQGVIHAATQSHPQLPAAWPLGLLLGSSLFITLYYLRRITRTAKEEGPA
jgi:uncharacterized membrane protein